MIRISLSTTVVPTINAFTTMMMSSNTIQFIEYKVIKFLYFPDGTKYMQSKEDLDDVFLYKTIQQQIKILLWSICFRLNLWYIDAIEKGVLTIFINNYSNVLCFFFEHWNSLLQNVFPNLVGKHQKFMSFQLITLGSKSKTLICNSFWEYVV